MSDKNFDPAMKDTCELKEAWADGKKLYYVEDIPGLLEQIASLNTQLAKANERVALLERVEKIFNESPELTFENVKVMFNDELNKVAIEKKIDGVQLVIDALASKGMLDTLTNFDINSVVEQLRKEQPSEQ